MKKIFFAAAISLVTVLCVSATVANIPSDDYSSSVTATIAGSDESIDFDTKTLVTIYNLMPQKVNNLCAASYKDIAPRIDASGSKSFTYEGVWLIIFIEEQTSQLRKTSPFIHISSTLIRPQWTAAVECAIGWSLWTMGLL